MRGSDFLDVYALAPKRCPHCVRVLATVALDDVAEFGVPGPLVVCEQCDGLPSAANTVYLPDDWD